MTWLRRGTSQPVHRCPLPKPFADGDVWECDDCHRVWKARIGEFGFEGWYEVLPWTRWWYRTMRDVDASSDS